MKKRSLSSLNLNKKSISNLSKIAGGMVATSKPIQAQTCEGPCPGGTGSCHPINTVEDCTISPGTITAYFSPCLCTEK